MRQFKLYGIIFPLLWLSAGPAYSADTLYDERFQEWRKKARHGNARAQYKLGNSYLHGNGVRVDIKKAVFWFRKSAAQGNVKAAYRLGVIYYGNLDGSRNYSRAFKWFLKAASKGHGMSQYYLALMYKDGQGVRKDRERSARWARKAASSGIGKAKKLLASYNSTRLPEPKASRLAHKDVAPPVRRSRRQAVRHKLATRKLLARHKWSAGDKTVEGMLLALDNCINGEKTIRCKSKRLKSNTRDYTADYLIETLLKDFDVSGRFVVKYRLNYLFVMPADPDDPDPKYYIPAVGPDKTITMHCQMLGKARIKCLNKKSNKVIVYTRS